MLTLALLALALVATTAAVGAAAGIVVNDAAGIIVGVPNLNVRTREIFAFGFLRSLGLVDLRTLWCRIFGRAVLSWSATFSLRGL